MFYLKEEKAGFFTVNDATRRYSKILSLKQYNTDYSIAFTTVIR